MTPAAHYSMAGVATDLWGRTSLGGLWACGEVTSTGVHGANRLASNSLLEALVWGDRVARDIGERTDEATRPGKLEVRRESSLPADGAGARDELRRTMWEHVGLVRDEAGLDEASARIDGLSRSGDAFETPGEFANLLTVARMVTTAAKFRQESRGGHYRRDFPESEVTWSRRLDLDLQTGPTGRLSRACDRCRPAASHGGSPRCLGASQCGGARMTTASEHNAVRPLPPVLYEPVLDGAFREDLGRAGDLTTDAIVPVDLRITGELRAREDGRVAGLDVALAAFRRLDPSVQAEVHVPDGADVAAGQVIASVEGLAREMLTAERTALNLLGRLCGIATTTRGMVRALEGTKAQIVCTRKTTPLLRALEKRAVRLGGGANHRFGLDDAVLIKDNHRAIAGSAAEAVRRARAHVGHLVKLEIEVDDLTELEDILALGVDAVLLDNMDADTLRKAVAIVNGRAITEASGGITPDTAADKAASGVDLLSVGFLTHSAPCFDVGLDVDLDQV